MGKPITIFISYAHKDASYLLDLQTFLKPYVRNGTIEIWTDKEIVAGQPWNEMIKTKLKESEIILFLVSPDFLASDYIFDTEIADSLNNQDVTVIPVIIRPVDLSLLKINYLQVIPTGAKAVTKWDNKDDAWNDIISSLKRVFNNLNKEPQQPVKSQDAITINAPAFQTDRKNLSDKLVLWLFVLLIAVSISVFVFGMINSIAVYSYSSIAGMGAGFGGYVFMRKL